MFLESSVGQKLAGLPLWAGTDTTPGVFLGGQDYSWPVAGSLKAPTKAPLSMSAAKLLSLSRKMSRRPPTLPSD